MLSARQSLDEPVIVQVQFFSGQNLSRCIVAPNKTIKQFFLFTVQTSTLEYTLYSGLIYMPKTIQMGTCEHVYMICIPH